MRSNKSLLQEAIGQYPAMSNVYNDQNTSVSVANSQRLQQLKAVGGQGRMMETWFPDDEGDSSFPHPAPGKFNFEFYDQNAYNDPEVRKSAIFLDALHGMKQDPNYAAMRNEFNKNWNPQELDWIKQKYSTEANKGESLASYVDRTVIDAYLRGAMNPMSDQTLQSGKYKDEYAQMYRNPNAQNYSRTQKQIIGKMQNYLKTGR